MNNYERITPNKPKNIEKRHAYLLGGGIGSLSAAAFLIRDGKMPGENIHIYEKLKVLGGAMDGTGSSEKGYTARGIREIEAHFECFMDLYATIPSLNDPSKSVLDEFKALNIKEPIESHCRIIENQGQKADFPNFGLSVSHAAQLSKLHLSTEEAIGEATIEDYFDASFFESNFWFLWASMFAFEPWHSVIEVKRYMARFMHLIGGMSTLSGILKTEYNQYDSLILPLVRWLETKGVCFETGCKVLDIDFDFSKGETRASSFKFIRNNREEVVQVTSEDIVLFTNGSLTTNSSLGDFNSPAIINRSDDKGVFSIWETIAKKSPSFGHPEKFISDIDKTKWMSFTITLKDDDILFPYVMDLTEDMPGTGGAVTIKDSSWLINWGTPKDPHFRGQPENVKVIWGYALNMDVAGDYVKKTYSECSGKEIFMELLYHIGLEDRIPEILSHTVNVIPAMLPYITSQFMPRKAGDRPEVIPQGSKNFGFLGQYTEIPDDCVFTVEYSVRSAMMAVYGLLELEKEVTPVYPSQYDVRVITQAVKTCLGLDKLPLEDISLGRLLEGSEVRRLLSL